MCAHALQLVVHCIHIAREYAKSHKWRYVCVANKYWRPCSKLICFVKNELLIFILFTCVGRMSVLKTHS